MRMGTHIAGGCVGALVAIAACSSADGDSASFDNGELPGPPGTGGFPNAGAGTGGTPGGPAGTGGLPPEVEKTTSFELPHAGERYVYVANPDSNTVAVIDSTTLSIQTIEAGAKPRFLQTLAGRDAAIVLNVDSHDATIVRTTAAGSTTSKVDVERGSNAIAVSEDGKHAIVYFDAAIKRTGDDEGSLQDVTVITLDDGADRAVNMSVGFRPSQVAFSSGGGAAYVVTEDGVSILDFADIDRSGAGIAKTVRLGNTGVDKTLDVSITKDGAYALARRLETSELRLVDLASGSIKILDVGRALAPTLLEAPDAGAPPSTDAGATEPPPPPAPAIITDVDLSPGGDYALAVIRDRNTVARIAIPGGFEGTGEVTVREVPGELIGSVTLTPDGKRAMLFTTVVPTNERLTILELDSDAAPRPLQLRKSVASVVVSPDSKTALVIHAKLPGSPDEPGIDVDAKTDRQDGYTLVALDDGYVKLQTTPAPLGPTTIVPDGSHLFALFAGANQFQVEGVDLRSFRIRSTTLGSRPVSIGSVPASKRVFVGQDHPDGRISFIDWDTGGVQSVTGFELNSRIRE